VSPSARRSVRTAWLRAAVRDDHVAPDRFQDVLPVHRLTTAIDQQYEEVEISRMSGTSRPRGSSVLREGDTVNSAKR